MASLAGGRVRPVVRLWHRWFGLLAGLWLLLLALTGSAIAFYDELDTALNPDLRRVQLAVAEAPIDEALARAQAALPGFVATQIDLPDRPGESIWMLGRAPLPGGERPRSMQVFADPADGRVLGWRESGKPSLDRRHLMDLIYGLHVDLLLGAWATWCLGLISLLWVLDHFLSLVLAVPKIARWRDAFVVAGRKGSLKRLYDLHRAPGMWLFPVTLVLAVTGLVLAWPDDSRNIVRTMSPVSERLHEGWPDVEPPAQPISLAEAMTRTAPRETIDSLRLLPDHGVYVIRTFDRRDPDDQGRLWTYVSMADGRVVGQRHDNGQGAGDTFFAWQYPLHSGKAFGLAGRIVVALAGLVTAALAITGVMLWLRRRPRWIKPARP